MNFFTVDVEDWFQAGVMQKYLRLNPSMANQHRLEENLVVLLDMLDSYGYQGTFFCLGNLVGKYASLLKLIAERGHEVASHGMTHTNLTSMDAKTLEWELKESKKIVIGRNNRSKIEILNKSIKILIVPIVPIINNLLWTILTKQQDHR